MHSFDRNRVNIDDAAVTLGLLLDRNLVYQVKFCSFVLMDDVGCEVNFQLVFDEREGAARLRAEDFRYGQIQVVDLTRWREGRSCCLSRGDTRCLDVSQTGMLPTCKLLVANDGRRLVELLKVLRRGCGLGLLAQLSQGPSIK